MLLLLVAPFHWLRWYRYNMLCACYHNHAYLMWHALNLNSKFPRHSICLHLHTTEEFLPDTSHRNLHTWYFQPPHKLRSAQPQRKQRWYQPQQCQSLHWQKQHWLRLLLLLQSLHWQSVPLQPYRCHIQFLHIQFLRYLLLLYFLRSADRKM